MRVAFQHLSLAIALVLMACDKGPEDRLLGYVEGDYVYMALPESGAYAVR
jgi:hypothetical protein